jgi:hypothetical protein
MQPDRVSFGIGSSNWAEDVAALSAVLGSPALVDEGRWAQFDILGTRVAVGTADELPAAALVVRVPDVTAAAAELRAAGWQAAEAVRGEHEVRLGAATPSGLQVILYQPLPRP